MMGTTHAFVGVLLTAPLLVFAPELAPVAALAGMAGGVFPDLDLFVGTHRKTLHYPVYYWVVALPAAAVAAASPTPLSVALAAFLVSAAVHSVTDWFGGSEELRPWERTSPRAVYLHPRKRWLRPRHVVRYDGAPEDLGLTLAGAVPAALYFGSTVRLLTVGGVVVAVVYTLFRKHVPDVLGL